MRVLLVEDHAAIREMIADHLRERGFALDAVDRAEPALAAARVAPIDAVVLDLGLPDMDGLQLLAALRALQPQVPAIIVTARDGVEARLRAVLRRVGTRRETRYSLGGVTFDTVTREASAFGKPLELTRREAALLEELLRVPGQVITKDRLEDRLYALEDAGSTNALEAAVSRLRRKLANAQAALSIETKWGIGYRLVEAQAR